MLNIPVLLLIFANMFPLFGVLFGGWDVNNILFLYWFENVVIGLYNVLKMLIAQKPNVQGFQKTILGKTTTDKSKSGMIMFFILHYGLFTLIRGVFVNSMLIRDFYFQSSLVLGIVFLFTSHGVSYIQNYIGAKEYELVSSEDLMFAPYLRVIIMHLTVLFGAGFVINIAGGTVALGPLIILITLKTLADLASHYYGHNKLKSVHGNEQNISGAALTINLGGGNSDRIIKLIKRVFPDFEKNMAASFKKSVENGQWARSKSKMSHEQAEIIEKYWRDNHGINVTNNVDIPKDLP